MVSLHKADYLVHGNPIGAAAVLARLNPTESSYTAVMEHPESGRKYFSQVIHPPGSRSAHFSFLAPDLIQNEEDFLPLFDFLCFQAGEMGALNVLAEIEESHALFEALRRVGFCVFSWESLWRMPDDIQQGGSVSDWNPPATTDLNTVRCLYQTLVPPLVQNAEPFKNGNTPRLLYKKNGDALAYVESISGSAGTYLIPLIHPSIENVGPLLVDLIGHFKESGKPLYMQVRSYQAWLADALGELKAEPSPRFALMVKHLAVGQLNSIKTAQSVRSDQRQADPAAPMVNNCTGSGYSPEGLK
ncbi:MAG TPA: hypothetical protein PKK59_06210 [Anaerolineaceae bacterium]|nr:hypothetical protein [Anaerolineaceae bacterium]